MCLQALPRLLAPKGVISGVSQEGKGADVPIYDFTLHRRSTETKKMDPADVVIIEGILVLHMEEIRELLHMKVCRHWQWLTSTPSARTASTGCVMSRLPN